MRAALEPICVQTLPKPSTETPILRFAGPHSSNPALGAVLAWPAACSASADLHFEKMELRPARRSMLAALRYAADAGPRLEAICGGTTGESSSPGDSFHHRGCQQPAPCRPHAARYADRNGARLLLARRQSTIRRRMPGLPGQRSKRWRSGLPSARAHKAAQGVSRAPASRGPYLARPLDLGGRCFVHDNRRADPAGLWGVDGSINVLSPRPLSAAASTGRRWRRDHAGQRTAPKPVSPKDGWSGVDCLRALEDHAAQLAGEQRQEPRSDAIGSGCCTDRQLGESARSRSCAPQSPRICRAMAVPEHDKRRPI